MLPKKEQMYKSRRLFTTRQLQLFIPLHHTILQKYIFEKVAHEILYSRCMLSYFCTKCTLKYHRCQQLLATRFIIHSTLMQLNTWLKFLCHTSSISQRCHSKDVTTTTHPLSCNQGIKKKKKWQNFQAKELKNHKK